MKRAVSTAMLVVFAATPAAAQWLGLPAWNAPKGGTGITISGDYGKPNSNYGKGNAFGARGSIGIGTLTLTAGLDSWKPEGATNSLTSVGGQGAFRVIGGSLIPVSVNLQVGAGRATCSGCNALTTILAGGGVSVNVPTPGVSIEPYVSITNRWHKTQNVSGTESNIGWVLGANVGLGMVGFHIAYDSEKDDAGVTGGVLGIGAHVSLKAPVGM